MKVTELLKLGKSQLNESGRGDAELLMAGCLGTGTLGLFLCKEEVSPPAEKRFIEMVAMRKTGMPVPYITGDTEFMGLKFFVDKNVLIPRQETEILVEKAIELAASSRSHITALDIGTGSGNIAVTLARHFDDINVVAVDVSASALALAKKNAAANGVEDKIIFWHTDVLAGPFLQCLPIVQYDLIVSNPPYIKSSEIAQLPIEVRHEPLRALDGGGCGMKFYEKIIPGSRKLLKKNGCIAMEIGHWHSGQVKKIMRECGYDGISVIKDYSGEERVIYGQNHN